MSHFTGNPNSDNIGMGIAATPNNNGYRSVIIVGIASEFFFRLLFASLTILTQINRGFSRKSSSEPGP